MFETYISLYEFIAVVFILALLGMYAINRYYARELMKCEDKRIGNINTDGLKRLFDIKLEDLDKNKTLQEKFTISKELEGKIQRNLKIKKAIKFLH